MAGMPGWTEEDEAAPAPGSPTGPACEVGAPCGLDARLIGGDLQPLGDTPAPPQLTATQVSSQLAFGQDGRFLPEQAGSQNLILNARCPLDDFPP